MTPQEKKDFINNMIATEVNNALEYIKATLAITGNKIIQNIEKIEQLETQSKETLEVKETQNGG